MPSQATRSRIYGSKALGNRDALARRLRAARQRAAALLVASLREAERDASFGSWEAPAVTAERELAAEALPVVVT